MSVLPALALRIVAGCARSAGDDPDGDTPSGTTLTEGAEHVPGADDPTDAVFDPARIAAIALTMDPSDWASLRDDPWGAGADWVSADFAWDGEVVPDVAVRPFGYGSRIGGKPSLKISFDRSAAGRAWRGLEQLKLDNSSQDATFLHERVGNAILRRFGVPAPRTGWAELAVNGDDAGFFVVLEPIDDRFLERWFGHDDGALYGTRQGAWGHGLTPFQRPWSDYYETQTGAGGDGSALITAADALASGDDAAITAALDTDGFLRESLARSAFGSWDSFSADGNNFYLYDDHGLVRIIPWDLDYDFETPGVANALAVDPRAPWLTSPWSSDSVTGADYVDPVLSWHLAEGADTDGLLVELGSDAMAFDTVDAEVAASAALIRDAVAADPLGYGGSFDRNVAELRLFLHTRTSALLGREAKTCPEAPDGVLRAADLAIDGEVGWGALLVDATDWGPGFVIAGETYCTGVFAHAPSSLTVDVPAGCDVLSARVGLQDWDQACGDGATFRIEQGGAELWRSATLANYSPAEPTGDIAVAAGALTLIADPNGDYACDTAVWADLEVTCS